MAKNRETIFTNDVCKELKAMGAIVIQYSIAPHVVNGRVVSSNKSGVPDRWVSHRLFTGWLEFKIEQGRLSPLQTNMIQQMNTLVPGSAFVIRKQLKLHQIEDAQGIILGYFNNGYSLLMELYKIKQQSLLGDIWK